MAKKIESSIGVVGDENVRLDEIERGYYTSVPLDSLYAEIETLYNSASESRLERARLALLMGVYYERPNPGRSGQYYDEAMRIAEEHHDKRVISDCLQNQASRYFQQGELKSADRILQQALEYAIEAHHTFRIAFSYYSLGLVALRFGAEEAAAEMLGSALKLTTQHGYLKLQIRIYWQLAELHLYSHNLEKAKNYAMQALNIATEIKGTQELLIQKIRLATVELELKDYREVTRLVAEVQKGLDSTQKPLLCVSHTLLGKVNEARRKYDEAEKEFRLAVSLADYPGAERVRSNTYVHLAELYLKMKKLRPALKESLVALKDAAVAQDIIVKKEAVRCIHDCYKALGKYKEAHRYLEQFNELVAESDKSLLKSRLEYYALKTDLEKERLLTKEKTRQSDLLRLELEQKERELTEKTRHLIKQTEALTQFRDDLRAIIKRTPPDDPLVKQIKARLDALPEGQIRWEEFDELFRSVHPVFHQILSKKHPKLTKMERKICALLRLELTSVDIAKLLYLSERSIENHRYRLRAKIGLNSEKSIHEYLSTIA